MSQNTNGPAGPADSDHASQALAGAKGELEAVLRGYLHIVHALALITRDEVEPMLHAAVTDIHSSRPTGHPVRHLLGWIKQQTHTRVDEATAAALRVLATDLTQQLGHLITSG